MRVYLDRLDKIIINAMGIHHNSYLSSRNLTSQVSEEIYGKNFHSKIGKFFCVLRGYNTSEINADIFR